MSDILKETQYRELQLKELNDYLICALCDGYFRFAHTISECGHTFCRECLKVKKPKKCPQCNINIASSQIKKDPLKQNIVDILCPQFQNEDQKVLNRLKQLFGDGFDEGSIQDLLKDHDYMFQSRRKKVKHENGNTKTFQSMVQETLAMNMDDFKRDIYDAHKFPQLLERAKAQMQTQAPKRPPGLIPKKPSIPSIKREDTVTPVLTPQQSTGSLPEHIMIALLPYNYDDEKILNANWDIKLKTKNNLVQQILKLRNYVFDQIQLDKCIQFIDQNRMQPSNIQLYYLDQPIRPTTTIDIGKIDEPLEIKYEVLFKK